MCNFLYSLEVKKKMSLFIFPPYVPSFFTQGQFIHTLSDLALELKWFFFHPPLKKDIKCKEQNVYRNIYRYVENLARFVDLT